MTNDTINWLEDEEQMFENWLACEKKEWGKFEYGEFKSIPLGIENDVLCSIWMPTLYRQLVGYKASFGSLCTYSYSSRGERSYIVDLRYKSFMFRVTISIEKERFYSDLFFKQKENHEYWTIKNCEKLEKEVKEEFKTGFLLVCEVYEDLKKFVQNESSNRLLILMKGLTLRESGVVRTKNIIKNSF